MIHCEKCKHINPMDAETCGQCGANLLPGESIASRAGGMGCFFAFGAGILVFAWVLVPAWTQGGPSVDTLIEMAFTFVLGPLGALVAVLFGLWWAFRKTSLPERYEKRAKRHVELDRKQAIADFSAIVDLASGSGKKTALVNYTDVLIQRGELYKKEGQAAKAKEDWLNVLNKIDKEISLTKKPEPALEAKRTRVSQLLEKVN